MLYTTPFHIGFPLSCDYPNGNGSLCSDLDLNFISNRRAFKATKKSVEKLAQKFAQKLAKNRLKIDRILRFKNRFFKGLRSPKRASSFRFTGMVSQP